MARSYRFTPADLRRRKNGRRKPRPPPKPRCPECAEPIEPNAAFCPTCGLAYEGTDDSLLGYSINCKCGGRTVYRRVRRGQYWLRAWVCERCGKEILHPEDKQRFMFRSLFSTRFWGY